MITIGIVLSLMVTGCEEMWLPLLLLHSNLQIRHYQASIRNNNKKLILANKAEQQCQIITNHQKQTNVTSMEHSNLDDALIFFFFLIHHHFASGDYKYPTQFSLFFLFFLFFQSIKKSEKKINQKRKEIAPFNTQKKKKNNHANLCEDFDWKDHHP